jgi:hypothetical protein
MKPSSSSFGFRPISSPISLIIAALEPSPVMTCPVWNPSRQAERPCLAPFFASGTRPRALAHGAVFPPGSPCLFQDVEALRR